MSNNQDARPFVDLRKDAEEFRIKFDEDIEECLSFLDAKITALICDPDSSGTRGKHFHQNALAEFSKSKYDIYIGMKSLINVKEREWLDYIAEMKKLFIENVEIFLAGTKLEVKLPPSESVSSHGPRKSPDNRKSSSASVTSSVFPILNALTKTIPVGVKAQFNRSSKLLTTSIKLAKPPYKEEMDIDEAEFDRSQSRSSSGSRPRKLSDSDLNTSQSNPGRRSSLKKEMNLGLNQNSSILEKQTDIDVSESEKDIQPPSKVHGRRGKLVGKKSFTVNTNNFPPKTRGRPGKSGKTNSSAEKVVQNNSSSADENEIDTTEANGNEISLKGRKRRSALKAKPNDFTVVAQTSSSTDENEAHEIESNRNEIPTKGRRGRLAPKTKTKDLSVPEKFNNEVHRSRRAALKNGPNVSDQNVAKKKAVRGRKSVKSQLEEETYEPGPSQSPKKVSFDLGDSSDELNIQTPVARPAKSAARRKTLLPNLEVTSGSDIIPGNPSRSKAKRKTISGVAELETLAPSKRLKISQKNISSQDEDSGANDNLLESDDNYSEWMPLKNVDGKIPTQSAIYELKVWRAKKPAYVGSCESLRQKLTLYKLRQNSGHKHLDKFIDRNYDDIQVRYEVVSSFNYAKEEVKDRIKSFVAQYKTTPAYN